MSATPTFFVVLDLIVSAFHLDSEQQALCGRGKYQALLAGRRIDRNDKTTQSLMLAFASALLESNVLPALNALLKTDVPAESGDALLAEYLGDAVGCPEHRGEPAQTLRDSLIWLAERHERLFAEARSQPAAANLELVHALPVLLRFLSHHLSVAIGALLFGGFLTIEDLRFGSRAMSWSQERPDWTPLRELAGADGIELTRARLKADLDFDRKTIDNLWNGGPDQPDLSTIRAITRDLAGPDEALIALWRRWYGLRALAQSLARTGGWDWFTPYLGSMLTHAEEVAESLRTTTLTSGAQTRLVQVAIWAGWQMPITRWLLGQRALQPIHPSYHHDFVAIGRASESLRVQQCLQLASATPALEQRFHDQGYSSDAAVRAAFRVAWELECDGGGAAAESSPIAIAVKGVLAARGVEDWPSMERHARVLVDSNPGVADNYIALAQALQMQHRHQEALGVVKDGLDMCGEDRHLRMLDAEIVMDRGECRGSHEDFSLALELLSVMPAADEDPDVLLLVADCHLALGAWEDALRACERLITIKSDCGEALAMASVCALKLGYRSRADNLAERARRRGAAPLLDLLRNRDVRGELGSRSIAPRPRWHRCSQ